MECSDVVNIALEISKTIGVMARLKHFLQTSVLLTQCLQFQRRALHLCYFSSNSDHAMPLFLRSNILPIDMLFYKSVGVLILYIDHDFVPLNLKNLG